MTNNNNNTPPVSIHELIQVHVNMSSHVYQLFIANYDCCKLPSYFSLWLLFSQELSQLYNLYMCQISYPCTYLFK